MTKQKQMAEKELDQVSGGAARVTSHGDPGQITYDASINATAQKLMNKVNRVFSKNYIPGDTDRPTGGFVKEPWWVRTR
jgi:bacteriocin-like protein